MDDVNSGWLFVFNLLHFAGKMVPEQRYYPVAEWRHQAPRQGNQRNRERADGNIGEPVCANHYAREGENHKNNQGYGERLPAEIAQHDCTKNKQHHTVIARETGLRGGFVE